ncbi:calcium-binding protein [Microlunatus endophyticus]|uniref:Calcium-binding protein n=1 Tax=Microlunatus endophyticus TaxID=1716077 RepID=A0A917S065_9ACTN|nr:SMP-30/gluconolactonase/LRE family protein [Microlunatus endophyticus]GGL48337.1 calcium-binding protein [Microlunatus endophyticus]
MVAAEQFSPPVAGLGEGAFWNDRTSRFMMVDLLRGDILTLDENGEASRTHVDTIASVLRRRTAGGFVVGVERGVRFLDDDLEPLGDVLSAFDTDGIRMNDGGCDPQGRLYVGSMAYAEAAGAGTLYRFDHDHAIGTVLGSVTVSNGVQWSADGSRVFYNDTATGRIAVFDFDGTDGSFHDQRDFVVLPEGVGAPDGMAIDAEDGLWVALWGGSAVHRYDADGKLTEVIGFPASKVTCPTFGGPDKATLYVTTASLDVLDEPHAGAVFRADVGVTGAPVYAFAG